MSKTEGGRGVGSGSEERKRAAGRQGRADGRRLERVDHLRRAVMRACAQNFGYSLRARAGRACVRVRACARFRVCQCASSLDAGVCARACACLLTDASVVGEGACARKRRWEMGGPRWGGEERMTRLEALVREARGPWLIRCPDKPQTGSGPLAAVTRLVAAAQVDEPQARAARGDSLEVPDTHQRRLVPVQLRPRRGSRLFSGVAPRPPRGRDLERWAVELRGEEEHKLRQVDGHRKGGEEQGLSAAEEVRGEEARVVEGEAEGGPVQAEHRRGGVQGVQQEAQARGRARVARKDDDGAPHVDAGLIHIMQ